MSTTAMEPLGFKSNTKGGGGIRSGQNLVFKRDCLFTEAVVRQVSTEKNKLDVHRWLRSIY